MLKAKLASINEMKGREFKLDSSNWLQAESSEDTMDLPELEELATDRLRSWRTRSNRITYLLY